MLNCPAFPAARTSLLCIWNVLSKLSEFIRLIFTLSSQWFAGSGKQTSKQIMRSQISWSYEKSRYCLHSNYPGSITVRIVLKEKLVLFLWGQKWVRNYNYLLYLFPQELKYFLYRIKKKVLSMKIRHLFWRDMGNSTHHTSKTFCALSLMFNNF